MWYYWCHLVVLNRIMCLTDGANVKIKIKWFLFKKMKVALQHWQQLFSVILKARNEPATLE